MLHMVLGQLHRPCVVRYFFTERPEPAFVESLQNEMGLDNVVDLTDISDQKATKKICFHMEPLIASSSLMDTQDQRER